MFELMFIEQSLFFLSWSQYNFSSCSAATTPCWWGNLQINGKRADYKDFIIRLLVFTFNAMQSLRKTKLRDICCRTGQFNLISSALISLLTLSAQETKSNRIVCRVHPKREIETIHFYTESINEKIKTSKPFLHYMITNSELLQQV